MCGQDARRKARSIVSYIIGYHSLGEKALNEPIIDAHHHIWRAARTPWLSGPMQPRIFGEYAAIRRDYTIHEYLEDARPSGVAKSVYIQINVAPGDEVEEVAWTQSVGETHGFPHGVVGYADLSSPDVGDTLDRQQAHSRLRGIRQQLHWHENPLYRFAARPDIMSDAAFRNGFRALAARGLLFELQVFSNQMRDAAQLVQAFPGVTFVLLHAGMPEDRSSDGRKRWQEGMQLLAANPNVCVKLSGLGTFTHTCSVELWKPIVEETLDFFGPARCLFGSNFPIEKLWTGYRELVAVMQGCLAGLSRHERRSVLHDNAQRIYGP
jgi:predicted TIM-barrel fold metal-dependent hydrolase